MILNTKKLAASSGDQNGTPSAQFSKNAAALFAMHYNIAPIHKTLRVTPAMAVGVTDRLWEIGGVVKVPEEWETRQMSDTEIPAP